MNLMIERAFIVALLLSISGFVFCAIFLPFEKIAYKWTSARTMVYVNTVALFSFVTPLYFVISLRDGSEKANNPDQPNGSEIFHVYLISHIIYKAIISAYILMYQ